MRKKYRSLFILGTRPEAIKLAPLIKKMEDADIKVCVTGQHKEMIKPILDFFSIPVDYNLNIMRGNQSLFAMTAKILLRLEGIIEDTQPDIVFVQGDTTSAFVGALAGFYKKIKIAHIEAGLRSKNKYSPFPEEINRILIDHLSDFLFAPTNRAKDELLKEGINPNNIYVVGNTGIDALLMGLKFLDKKEFELLDFFKKIDFTKKILLVTAHRRESFGKPFENICYALRDLACNNEIEIVYPVHLNPNIKKTAYSILKNIKNIHLIKPLSYPHLIWLMKKCYLILTDSGGIQEEAPSLGKPVLVMREVTERIEGIEAGNAILVGTERKKIKEAAEKLLFDELEYKRRAIVKNPYGDGKSSDKILRILRKVL